MKTDQLFSKWTALLKQPISRRVQLFSLFVLIFILVYSAYIREYLLYLTQSRPSVSFQFTELSDEWSEEDLKKFLKQIKVDCYTNRPGEYLDDRSCFADIESLNGHGAMTLAFYFKSGKLNHAAVNIPWWLHLPTYWDLEEKYGKPAIAHQQPIIRLIGDKSLHGWQLTNHSAIFYNRGLPDHPVSWSSIFWVSPRQCALYDCSRILEPER